MHDLKIIDELVRIEKRIEFISSSLDTIHSRNENDKFYLQKLESLNARHKELLDEIKKEDISILYGLYDYANAEQIECLYRVIAEVENEKRNLK